MSPCNPLYPQKGQSHLSSTPLFPVLQKSPFSSFSSSIFHIGHEGGEWAGWQSSSCIHSLFRPSYPPFSSPTYPCFPAFPVLPCLYLLTSQKPICHPWKMAYLLASQKLALFPKTWYFSQKLPQILLFGSFFKGETRGIGGVVAAVPSVLSKQCLSSLPVSF